MPSPAMKESQLTTGYEKFSNWIQICLLAFIFGAAPGCQTGGKIAATDPIPYLEVKIREGDTLKIAFPGAPGLDMNQQVRRDGKITLSLGGEVTAAGLSPKDLEKEILRLHGTNLTVQQVVVTMTSPGYPVFVNGAVLRPGKLSIDRPITALEAIMEAGGYDNVKADLKKVTVIRQIDGKTVNYPVNIKAMIEGKQPQPFYLKPGDIVVVPEKFNWF